jgi:sporulation protein YlmC with PRC-barrel domain
LAHLLGRRVLDAAGSRVGKVSDVVVRWDANVTYPPVVGILVGVGRGFAFVDLQDVTSTQTGARLRSEQQTVSRPVRGESEVALARDVTAVPAISTTNLITRPATRMVP